jgi:cell division protein FtsI/penicillin-binding protein 2
MTLTRRLFLASALAHSLVSRRQVDLQASLSKAMAKAMAAKQGSALILDTFSGKALAQYRAEAARDRLVQPGSIIKPFVLMAMIQAGIVQANTRRNCTRKLRIEGRNLDCTHVDAGEAMDPVSAIAYSCNSYFTQVALNLEPRALVGTLSSFGLTPPMPTSPAQMQLLVLGEAGIRVTLPAVAGAYRRLALLKREPKTSLVLDGLAAATRYGTARLARKGSLAVSGKTGTAAERTGTPAHAWFAGFAPDIVVVIFLETGSGGADAAPIAGEIFAAL